MQQDRIKLLCFVANFAIGGTEMKVATLGLVSIGEMVRKTEWLYLNLLESKRCQTIGQRSRAVSRNKVKE